MKAKESGHGTVSVSIARAVLNAGARVVTYVPGHGANEVFADYNVLSKAQNPVSFNEEVAYSIAHGAALTGTRSVTLLKSLGLAKAGNSVSDSLYSGTTAGFLTVIFHDSSGESSESIFDTETFLRGIGIPYEVADIANIRQQIFDLFTQSEKRSLPYALIVESHDVTRLVGVQDCLVPGLALPEYRRDITQRVLCPFFNSYQGDVLKCKNEGLDWASLPRPAIPSVSDSRLHKWKPVIDSYAGLFSEFRSIRGSMVIGDTGGSSLFAFEPYNCIDITTYMGGSVPLAVGAWLAGYRDVWAVTGDFSFIAAGHMGLLESLQRGISLKVLVLYNGQAASTGGQPIARDSMETVLAGYKKYLLFIKNPGDADEIRSVLQAAGNSSEMRIVIADFRK
jgi:TPP-dependent indolepyruvate ferredoxin oxidoreductase alpha subunit